jgi:hypothetical protein
MSRADDDIIDKSMLGHEWLSVCVCVCVYASVYT